jgi:sialate O-acetylesterase
MFTVPLKMADTPQSDVGGTWTVCSPATVGNFSAAAYFFARELHKHRQVPVGIITAAYGASTAQAWIPREALAANPRLVSLLTDYDAAAAAYASGEAQKRYEKTLADWAATTQASKRPAHAARKPGAPRDPHQDQHNPSLLYNAMIAPILPYGIRGTIWYQGESNGVTVDRYETLMVTLIKDWRQQFGRGDFPFIQVQLAAYQAPTSDPNKSSVIAAVREAQQLAANDVPAGGLVTAVDIGDEKNVHPKNKQEVGRRLALAAQTLAYGEAAESSGPTFKSMAVEGGGIRIRFDHAGGGLMSKTPKLTGFAIAPASGHFVWADARIEGDSVIVSSDQVPAPAAVRYAWADNPPVSLFNQQGLPALPFRTDRPATQPAAAPQ